MKPRVSWIWLAFRVLLVFVSPNTFAQAVHWDLDQIKEDLDSEDWRTRVKATQKLVLFKPKGPWPLLVQKSLKDKHPQVRELGVEVLVVLANKKTPKVLRGLLSDPKSNVRLAAIEGLKTLLGSKSKKWLLQHYKKEKDRYVQQWIYFLIRDWKNQQTNESRS